MIVSRTELAESLGINPKTVDRLRGTVFLQVNDGKRRPEFDLAASVQAFAKYQSQKKRERQSGAESTDGSDDLLQSVLRRWKSKVRITRQKIAKLDSELMSFEDLMNVWEHIKTSTSRRLEPWPERVAERLVGIEDIPRASEVLREEIHALLNELVIANDLGEEDEPLPWETR